MNPVDGAHRATAWRLPGGDTALAMSWKLRWFTVRNPALASADQAQGIYISAVSGEGPGSALGAPHGEERYVLITENGCSDPFSDDQALQTDTFRINYLRRHLEAVKSAMPAGAPSTTL